MAGHVLARGQQQAGAAGEVAVDERWSGATDLGGKALQHAGELGIEVRATRADGCRRCHGIRAGVGPPVNIVSLILQFIPPCFFKYDNNYSENENCNEQW